MLRTDGACVRERIGRVVIMGGAIDVPGNATPSANQFLCGSIHSRQSPSIPNHALATRARSSPPTRYHLLSLATLLRQYRAWE